jgi:hypothetical protein
MDCKYNYLLLIAIIIFMGFALISGGDGDGWHYSSDGDLRGTQTKYLVNDTKIKEIKDSVNLTKAVEDFDSFACCYPSDCPQSINNPSNCECLYTVMCGEY